MVTVGSRQKGAVEIMRFERCVRYQVVAAMQLFDIGRHSGEPLGEPDLRPLSICDSKDDADALATCFRHVLEMERWSDAERAADGLWECLDLLEEMLRRSDFPSTVEFKVLEVALLRPATATEVPS